MSIRLEKTLPGFGFVRKSTGLTAQAEFDELLGILLMCAKTRPQVVRCWLDGTLTSWAVLHAAREDRLRDVVPDARTLMPLDEAFEAAWARCRAGEATVRRYRVSVAKLRRLRPELRLVADLATCEWDTLAKRWPGSPSDYMALYRTLSAFLTLHFGGKRVGRAHPWRAEVLDKLPRKVERPRTPSCTPEQFKAAVTAAREPYRAVYWALVATGLRWGEFAALDRAHLNPRTFEVQVPGTKTAASAATLPVSPRLWPWLEHAVPCPRAYGQVHREWRRASRSVGLDLRLHDLRHLFAQWAVNAGASEASVQGYLRHTEASTTRKYTLQTARRAVAETVADILTDPAEIGPPRAA